MLGFLIEGGDSVKQWVARWCIGMGYLQLLGQHRIQVPVLSCALIRVLPVLSMIWRS